MGCFLLAATNCASARAQELTAAAKMHERVQTLYSFSPSKVTDEVRASKSKEMDAFWSEVKDHKDAELPLLRNELRDASNPPFFFADASGLLLTLSKAPADLALAVTALTRVDLADFQSRQYLYEVHGLALQGANVAPAALHMLDDPKFVVYLPEHGAYKLDQPSCLQVALMPLATEVWLPEVMERIHTERDETAMKSLLMLLFYAQTDEADGTIRSIASGTEQSAAIRGFAGEIVKHEKDIGVGKSPSESTEKKLREERRLRMAAVSDEAMDDMYELTDKIARARTVHR